MPRCMLIVEDHPIFSSAVEAVLRDELRRTTFAVATTLGEALRMLAAGQRFDLVLLDLLLPDTNGFDGLIDLRARFPKLPVAVLSAFGDEATVRRAEVCGAAGFITKSVSKEDLVKAIRTIMRGGTLFAPETLREPADRSQREAALLRLETLTPQQLRVLKMLCAGLLNKQIAFALDVGETTIKAHVSEILRKLGVASRTQAVLEMSKLGLDKRLAFLLGEEPDVARPRPRGD